MIHDHAGNSGLYTGSVPRGRHRESKQHPPTHPLGSIPRATGCYVLKWHKINIPLESTRNAYSTLTQICIPEGTARQDRQKGRRSRRREKISRQGASLLAALPLDLLVTLVTEVLPLELVMPDPLP